MRTDMLKATGGFLFLKMFVITHSKNVYVLPGAHPYVLTYSAYLRSATSYSSKFKRKSTRGL